MYVCGITPYDATHLGHASTYLAFDLLNRAWRDAGVEVMYVQNVTDVDDPLLARATETGVDWQDLAAEQIELFRSDMNALRVIPPAHYIGAVETIPRVERRVVEMLDSGAAYRVELPAGVTGGQENLGDVYADIAKAPHFGEVCGYDHETMMTLFGERGGDPDRPGKRNQLDPLLWRQERPGEPAWPSERLGAGRPGWHIECAAIALDYLSLPFDVQGGGQDLIFPHHEMGATHGEALSGVNAFARRYVHSGMVGYHGSKMSKSLGNLVFVSRLRAQGHDPMAIRLALLTHHYRSSWEWHDGDIGRAEEQLNRWRESARRPTTPDAQGLIDGMRTALRNDLDAPHAVDLIDEWVSTSRQIEGKNTPADFVDAVDALLGIDLR